VSGAKVSEEPAASVFREEGIFYHTGRNRSFVMCRYTSIHVQSVATQRRQSEYVLHKYRTGFLHNEMKRSAGVTSLQDMSQCLALAKTTNLAIPTGVAAFNLTAAKMIGLVIL
jgi:hypothetical protein